MKPTWRPGKGKVGRVAMIFLGGCGNNIMRQLIEGLDPNDYPDFYLLGSNTDAQANEDRFGDEENEHLKRWIDAGRASTFTTGGEEITGGFGAGAIPDVGKRAAEHEATLAIIREFIEPASEVGILFGAAGGTGGGAGPVVAKFAKDMGKNVFVQIVMPRRNERRDTQAMRVLNMVQRELKIPTMPIYNRYIDEYRASLPAEERKKFLPLMGWDLVNTQAIIPPIWFYREINQVAGDVKNLDQADKKTAFSSGENIFTGYAEILPGELDTITSEEIWKRLSAPRCQNPQGYKNGESVVFWVHGPLSDELVEEVKDRIDREIFGTQSQEGEVPKVHWGMREKVSDGKIWVAMFVVSKVNPISALEQRAPVALVVHTRKQRIPTYVTADGVERGPYGLWNDLLERYEECERNSDTPSAAIEDLRNDILDAIGVRPDYPSGLRPDYPSWLRREKPEVPAAQSIVPLGPNFH